MTQCSHCHANALVQAGKNRWGSLHYRCKKCKRYTTPEPEPNGYSRAIRRQTLQLYLEGNGRRRIGRLLQISHQSVANWVNTYHNYFWELMHMEVSNHMTTAHAQLPFPEFVRKVIAEAEPMSQNTGGDNWGFGWIYYALVRNLRPDFGVAIGSRRGFMPFCAARAVQDNGHGKIIFIDPSYSGGGHPGWGGEAFWSDAEVVEKRITDFELSGWITHLKMTSKEAFPHAKAMIGRGNLGLVIIDGAHTYENSLEDFELYASLINEGFVLFHDSTNEVCEVSQTIETLRTRGYPMVTLHREVGLTIVEVWHPPAVEDIWGYLCRMSNRGELLLQYAKTILRPGDRVFDVYCGYSPLGTVLKDVTLFGCDRDAKIITKLRANFPEHHWEQIDELNLPFAKLPKEVDVLLGLGLSRGHASWDPQHVLENVRYLLGRYFPRACLFEAAVDYGRDILEDLQSNLLRLGYTCRQYLIETNMDSFPRRIVMIAERRC